MFKKIKGMKKALLTQSELVGNEKEIFITKRQEERKEEEIQGYMDKLERIAYKDERAESPSFSASGRNLTDYDERKSIYSLSSEFDTVDNEGVNAMLPQPQSWSSNRFGKRLGLPSKVNEMKSKQQIHSHTIQDNDLVYAKSKLKKINKAFKAVRMNREDILKDMAIHDHLPLVSCQNSIRNLAASADLVSLSFSGIDQLTDVFFYYIYVTKVRLPSLKTFIATGCNKLSDRGIRWLKLLIPKPLDKVNLSGCSKLTEKSLYYLTHTVMSQTGSSNQTATVANIPYMEITMMGTAVSVVSRNLLTNSNLSLKLNGCPLVSPPIEKFKARTFDDPSSSVTKVSSLPVYKVVVLRHPDICSRTFCETLPNVSSTIRPDGVTYVHEWQAEDMSERFNIIEINCEKIVSDTFITEGCIVLVPFTDDKMNEPDLKTFISVLTEKFYKVMYKCFPSTCVLTLLTNQKPADMNDDLAHLHKEVTCFVRWLHNLVDDSIKNMTMKKWKIDGLDFIGQEYLASMVAVKDMITPDDLLLYPFIKTACIPLPPPPQGSLTIIKTLQSGSLSLSTGKDILKKVRDIVKPSNPMTDLFKMAVDDVTASYHSYWADQLQPDTLAAIAAMPSYLVADMNGICAAMSPKVCASLHPTNAVACLTQIVRIMSVKGMAVMCDADTKVVCTNMSAFCDLISDLHSLPEPTDPSVHIRCVTSPICLWTEDKLRTFLSGECHVDRTHVGLIIEVVTKQGVLLQVPCDALNAPVPYVYLLTHSLPESAPDDLVHFWPDSLADCDVQAERFYQFTPGLPDFFIPVLLQHLSRICEFKRVWRGGAFISQAPVDILIQFIRTSNGLSFVYVGGRVEDTGQADNAYRCLWGCLRLYTDLMDYMLMTHSIFANVTVPCRTCVSDRSRYIMADTSLCHHFALHSLLCGFDRGPQCRMERRAIPLNKQAVALHIGSMVTSLVPLHDISYIANTKRHFDFFRCFQCRRCTVSGVACTGNNHRGLTPNHCSCSGESILCPCCGICQRCIKFLSEMEAVLSPSFSSRRRTFVDSSEGDSAILGGSMISGNAEGTTVQCMDWMTPEYFNRIDVCLMRGVKLALGLNLSKSKKQVTFELSSGVLSCGEQTCKGDAWRLKEGDSVSFVLHPHIPQKQFDESESVRTYRLSEKMCLEYTGDDGEIVTARITGNNLQSITLVTDHTVVASLSNAVTVDMRRLTIHPPGYARHFGKHINGVSSQDFDWTKAIKDTPYILAPHWLFTEGQHGGCKVLEKSGGDAAMMKCTDLISPPVLECIMAHWLYLTERTLYERGGVNYSGTALVALPRDLSSLSWPSRVKVTSVAPRQCFPMCYIRGDSADMLSLRPAQPQPRFAGYRHPYWNVHFVNAPGFPYPEGGLVNSQVLLCFWNILLKFSTKLTLPVTDKMLPGVRDHISHEQLERNIQEYTHIQAMALFLRLGLQFTRGTFYDVESLEFAAQELQALVVENIDQSGLSMHTTTLTSDQILICHEHVASLQTDRNLNYFPQDNFRQYSQFIASLIIDGNKIHVLPENLFENFPGLQDFQFSLNGLQALPCSVRLCANLSSLRLGANHLVTLPPELAECKKLCRLEISANLMDEVPPVVMRLTALQRLYMQQMQLTELPPNIGDLVNLEVCLSLTMMAYLQMLYASGNCFTKLPASFTNLKKLNDLALNGVAWFDLRKNRILSREHFDRFLRNTGIHSWMNNHGVDKSALYHYSDEDKNGTLDVQELSRLNAIMFLLFPRLGYQDTSPPDDPEDVGACGVPQEILQLENLEYLSLQYQGLVSIPDSIANLSRLTVLNLAHNPYLTSISANAANLPLKRLELDGCPSLKTPPKEIHSRGFTSTFAYLKRLLSGSSECKRTKLMLVGLGGAGKTSLVKALLSGSSRVESNNDENITDGIDITDWTIQTDTDRITYSVWDFAGQTVYYNTHQFFLTERSVYLLLWNIRLGYEHAGLDFWLSSITVHAPNAPIFVIGTHLDQVSKTEIPKADISAQYPQIAGFHLISSYTGKGIPELQADLLDVTLRQPYMGEKIPGVWLNFEQAIISERTKESVVKYSKIEDIAANSGVFDQTEVIQAVQFLHDLGSLQHINNQFLRDYVVINPQWIVDVMACVVSVKDSPIKDGRFNHSDVGVVWRDYPQSLHQWLLRLTEEFDLTFPLKDENVNLVPCLLPQTQPDFDWPELNKHSMDRETKMVYKFTYLPAGLFNRGQVRLYQVSDSSLIWKKGSLLRKNGHIALLMQSKDNEMVVRAQGVRPGNILLMVHEVFEGLIAESFRGVTYDFLIPCPDCLKTHNKDPHMFAASTIRRATELTAPFLQCLKYFHTVSIIDLIASMPPDTNTDYDIHIVSAVRGLNELKKDISADVFVSFCSANLPEVSDKMIHPHSVCKDLEKSGYKCWFNALGDGEQSLDVMVKALMDCRVFVAFMTNEYVDDENCTKIFKYAQLILRKPIVLVVVKGGMEWQRSKLGIHVVDEVYVDMKNAAMYTKSFESLHKSVRDKIDHSIIDTDPPPVFISYAWKNSAEAVATGDRFTEGAVGPGDPRAIKRYLEKNGVRCWIDVERVGVNGLFDDITSGLNQCQVMVACVSDEYAQSPNCQKEFRFATSTLGLPIVLAVVGTTNEWRRSEIGYMSVGHSLVSFQEQSASAPNKLLQIVTEKLDEVKLMRKDDKMEVKNEHGSGDSSQKDLDFQELYELAQRKFMRQICTIAESHDLLYPRLIVADFKRDQLDTTSGQCLERAPEDGTASTSPRSVGEMRGLRKHESVLSPFGDSRDFHQEKFCFHILCEHEEGWHSVGVPVDAPDDFGQSMLDRCMPYLARITAILKYDRQLMLRCMLGQEGDHYLKWLEKTPQSTFSDFDVIYKDLRNVVFSLDHGKTRGKLARCHLPNGKTIWLCEEHQKMSRVTVLGNDAANTSHAATESSVEGYMLDALTTLDLGSLNITLRPTAHRDRKQVEHRKIATETVSRTPSQPSISEGVIKQAEKNTPAMFVGSPDTSSKKATARTGVQVYEHTRQESPVEVKGQDVKGQAGSELNQKNSKTCSIL